MPGTLSGYRIEQSLAGSGFWTLFGTTTQSTLVVTPLQPATGYEFRVLAFNPAGSSAWSNTAQATTLTEFAPGDQIAVVWWGPGQYRNNQDGSGNWVGLPGFSSGTTQLLGETTMFHHRPYGSSILNPVYAPNVPLSPRFNVAGSVFASPGVTQNLTIFSAWMAGMKTTQ
ncbi:MAG: fibronectin type III domain-containing protein [Verrucomicrobia bacterium]|nr:fibronectin type III domain-containing protein [Verrucomicrobiota bacterium]